MAERKRLGIRFDVGYKFSSGATIYFINIINALNTLPDERKPELYIFYLPMAPVDDIKAIGYPYLHLVPIKLLPAPLRAVNRIYRKFFVTKKFNLFNAKTTTDVMDTAFSLCIPCEDVPKKLQLIWYADLQTHHNPGNYSEAELKNADVTERRNIKAKYPVVLSSQWCIDDFKQIYPNYPAPVKRLRFAPTHPDFSFVQFDELKAKFNIDRPYFIVSNQYWLHKNHIAVFKAIKILKDKGYNPLCLCTGSPLVTSHKAKDYIDGLNNFIAENKLEENIRFLGFIAREEQLCLMQNSSSIIQPSFFESWNTTVEDAKALNKFIILSDLTIHREQMSDNCYFFDPNSETELADRMEKVLNGNYTVIQRDYKKNIEQFANDILEVFELN